VVGIGIILPSSPLGPWFGLVAPPLLFYAFLAAATAAYLVMVEMIKEHFFQRRDHGA